MSKSKKAKVGATALVEEAIVLNEAPSESMPEEPRVQADEDEGIMHPHDPMPPVIESPVSVHVDREFSVKGRTSTLFYREGQIVEGEKAEFLLSVSAPVTRLN